MTGDEVLLEAEGLGKAREGRWVLSDVSLRLRPGRTVHLRGANGAGKTTLLRILAGELAPSRGRVVVGGRVLGPGPREGRERLSFVPEILLPSPWLSPREYLELRASLRGFEDGAARAQASLDGWGLSAFAERPLETLSHGERRRVILAAGFQAGADVLLLDEPTVGLDVKHQALLAEQLAAAAPGRVIVVASHVERQGLPAFDDVLELVDGRLA